MTEPAPPRSYALGTRRGLDACASARGTFAVLALDHRQNLRRELRPADPAAVTYEEMVAFKRAVVRALAPVATGNLNTGNEDFIYLAATTGPLSLSLGLAVYEDERYPDYWVFGHKSESAMKSLIPGADDSTRISTQAAATTVPLNPTDALYREQLLFSGGEEKRRRASRVAVKSAGVEFEKTPMGRVRYVIDPKTGFLMRVLGTLLAEISPGKRSGAHRHMYEEVNYIISGQGYSLIEDRRYDWSEGRCSLHSGF